MATRTLFVKNDRPSLPHTVPPLQTAETIDCKTRHLCDKTVKIRPALRGEPRTRAREPSPSFRFESVSSRHRQLALATASFDSLASKISHERGPHLLRLGKKREEGGEEESTVDITAGVDVELHQRAFLYVLPHTIEDRSVGSLVGEANEAGGECDGESSADHNNNNNISIVSIFALKYSTHITTLC